MGSTEHCDWSDLPKDQCQHCKDGQRIVSNPSMAVVNPFADKGDTQSSRETFGSNVPPKPSGEFDLKYGAVCKSCGDWMTEGTPARFLDNQIVHAHHAFD